MERSLTGTDILAEVAGARPFWRARTADVQSWTRSLPRSATTWFPSVNEWIGEAWDGASDMEIGGLDGGPTEIVEGREILALLAKLRRGMPKAIAGSFELPDESSVRVSISRGGKRDLTIDIDLVDFILPLCTDFREVFGGKSKPSIAAIADGMLHLARMADVNRGSMARREQRLRRALEETTARIGDGAAPLWLRIEPIPHYEEPRYVTRRVYAMLLITLNADLVWAPIGSDDIYTVKHVRDHYDDISRDHRQRAAILRMMATDRTDGYISAVAFALVEKHGLDPVIAFRDAREAALQRPCGGLSFPREDGMNDRLYVREGTLWAAFAFEGGHFDGDTLFISGNHPETLALAAKGRRLSDFVAHPLLVSSGVVARVGIARQCTLYIVAADTPVVLDEAAQLQLKRPALPRAA